MANSLTPEHARAEERAAGERDYLGRQVRRLDRIGRRARRIVRPRWLALHRTKPLSDTWSARGKPVDRYYIERFLEENRHLIRGSVLEIKQSVYTDRFGAGVRRRDVLDADPTNERATIVADLTRADAVPSNSFDCFILTQTLQYVFDVRAAISHCHRILRPGGVLLCTVPSVSRIEPGSLEREYWRFTGASCRRLFVEAFGSSEVSVDTHGNVLSSIAFLAGLAREELGRRELDYEDEYFPLIVTVRATKAVEVA
jgi:SAM-dependent methyltransferase